MGIHKQQSSNQTQEQTAFTAFQPSFLNTNLVPETPKDYDFEKASNPNPTNAIAESELIPHWSGVTSHSAGIISYASSTPILNHKQKTQSKIIIEKQDLQSIQTRQIVFKERTVKNYQIFPGNTRFLCGGRFVTSRDYRGFLAALLLFITPVILFFIFTCPFLWKEVHPAIPIIFAYLFLIAFSSMLKTSWTDPGIIPRNLDILEDETSNESSSVINSSVISGYVQKDVQIKNTTWFLRYCETCKIYRPPRASHCRQCDNCVEFEDHHCIWLNNCVGKRNYRPFFTFIVVCVILCVFVIAFDIYQLFLISRNNPEEGFGFVFIQAPVSFVLTVYCFILLWMVGGLTVYHCTLIVRGVTTHEQLRSDIMKLNYPDLGVNPYNKKNPFKNMVQILCQPQPKSYLRRRKMADPVIENI